MFLATVAAFAIAPATAAQQQTANAPKPVTRAQFVASMDAAFAKIDANHDGSISASEMDAEQNRERQQVQAALRGQAEAKFRALDTNKDGQLSLPEFLAIVPQVNAKETAAQVVQQLDANHDGKVGAAEFRAPKLQAFDKADLNHDGTVTPDEERRSKAQK
jgi:Ca2+-binding EF-hand superfamily protein